MALALPDVTLIAVGANSMVDYMTALKAYFDATSTKFSVVANGGTNDAFTLQPVAAGENYYINFRRISTTEVKVSIDPLQNITAPGTTAVAPTVTDNSEWSAEGASWTITGGGAESLRFYLFELPDCIIVLNMDSGEAFNPWGVMVGRVMVPFFTDGVNGEDYCDGLGIWGGQPDINTSSGAFWVCSNASQSLQRGHRTFVSAEGDQWYAPFATDIPLGTTEVGNINGRQRFAPTTISLRDVDGSADSLVGYSKYMLTPKTLQAPGTRLDSGVDQWIYINTSAATNEFVLPWDSSLAPVF